jgi:hypothetical protein
MTRGYDADDPGRHLPFPISVTRSRHGYGLTAAQIIGLGNVFPAAVRFSARPLCADADPMLFFDKSIQSKAIAKKLCQQCPVIQECLDAALGSEIADEYACGIYGIYGGKTPTERHRIIRNMRKAKADV